MKKAFDQTVRDLKRGVNKKVLKVPGIEQKILDATSNESWGPHGSHLAELAQASRNFHEYQMIMNVIWKRINDTGKNWRHVYKALTVLEYLVANGSERVIDEIRDHAPQISTLSNFQYVDSGGRDQGSNVRRKSQSLVTLVNDKERIQEVRQKANANKDKYQSTGGANNPSSGYGDHYDDDRPEGHYGYRDDDRNGHAREREYGYKDEARYGRGGDSYNRDGDQIGRYHEEQYGRDGYREEDYRGRGTDDYQLGTRSVDRYTDRSFDDDDDHYSSRTGGGRTHEHSHDDRRLEQHLSEQNVGAPPSYDQATKDTRNHIQNERSGETVASPAHISSSPAAPKAASSTEILNQGPDQVVSVESPADPTKEVDAFDEFNPRGSMSAALPAASVTELDLLGSLSVSDSTNSLALMPMTSAITISEAEIPINSGFEMSFAAPSAASTVLSQTYENPFGDTPFKAIPQENFQDQSNNFVPVSSIQPSSSSMGSAEPFPPIAPKVEAVSSFGFGDMLDGISYAPSVANGQHSSTTTAFLAPEMPLALTSGDILDDILPRTDFATTVPSQIAHPTDSTNVQTAQTIHLPESGLSAMFPPQAAPIFSQAAPPAAPNNMQSAQLNFLQQQEVPASASLPSQATSDSSQALQPAALNHLQLAHMNFVQQGTFTSTSLPSQAAPVSLQGSDAGALNNMQPSHLNFLQQPGMSTSAYIPSLAASGSLQATQTAAPNNIQSDQSNFFQPSGVSASAPISSQAAQPAAPHNVQSAQFNLQQPGLSTSLALHAASTTSFGPPVKTQPTKFESKSTVWADTLSRGLVDLNISGPKTNPLADIGVDFDSINRMEKRKGAKSSAAPVTSTITMGKAMGAGSGIGRAGAGGFAPPPNPMMGSGIGMGGGAGMGMGGGAGTGMGVYGGGMNQPPVGMGIGTNMGMGMNMGMVQGAPMRPTPPTGMLPPGAGIPGVGYNPMMGMGSYGLQHPYGGPQGGSQQPYGGPFGGSQQPYGGGYR